MIVNPILTVLVTMGYYTGLFTSEAFPFTKCISDIVYAVAAVIYLVGICKRRPGLILPIIVLFHIGMIVNVAVAIWVLCAHAPRQSSPYWVSFIIESVVVLLFMLPANSLYHDFKERPEKKSADEAC